MRVLVACEYSGVVRRAFRERGHDAWSCDIIPSEDSSPFHIHDDVLNHLNEGWDLMIHHAPCTFILNSGCKHLYAGKKRWKSDGTENPRNPERWRSMEAGARFFKTLQEADIPKICGENPIMVGYAQDIVGKEWDQKIQPWEFGHTESKGTCLWLKNLPPLVPTKNVYEEMMKLPKKEREKVHYMSPGKNRGHLRSRTYEGIALAMAMQWG